MDTEPRTKSTDRIRDIIIGMSDGLTVPFALAAGLTGAVAAAHLVLTAGFAEMAAGSISMGLGGYLAARSDAEHYASEKAREEGRVRSSPESAAKETAGSLMAYGLSHDDVAPVVGALRKDHQAWVNFLMRNKLGLEEPHPNRAVVSALTIATAYIVGGIIPLSPYFFVTDARRGLLPSVMVTLFTLFVFGYLKGRATGVRPLPSAVQTVLIGGIAAGAAFFLASRF